MAEVETSETILFFPSRLHEDHPRRETLRLSHLDADRNLEVPVRTVRFYAGRKDYNAAQQFDDITGALSVALSCYYPLAGALKRGRPDDRLAVHCQAGQGVPVVRASSRRTQAYFSDLLSSAVDSLAPGPEISEMLEHPLTLQVTFFTCGGYSLGMCVHHCLCDGAGATLFLSAVAEIARGASEMSTRPVWARDKLLGPRQLPRVEVDFSPFLRTKGRISDPYGGGTFAREYFHVSDEGLERLRAQMQGAPESPTFTSFEAVVAFIWRSRVRASEVVPDTKVKLVFSMDVRRLLRPCLPTGYWGNGCVPVYAQTTAGELSGRPQMETAELIRRSKRGVTAEYVQSFIDFQELHYADGITVGENSCGFTDWRHLDHSSVDFGTGGPTSVLPLSFKLLGCLDLCFLLPYPSVGGVKKGGFRALVSISADALPAFREEMKSLAET
ncbi:HXXXD-type acyl-transferase family protein [Wolffia australiana]